ncbi:sugar-binding protein [Longispora fulva]|uniref:Raffinose/stachyose/melibiose transport system substrate-binding protein n=1 Tax=Longispora fulva TaxID=619741 RepID=A0A8J7GA47_9ACTN|nr:extracellular solute-binding protein [Longispora fulva]MBG6134544.1 raffinose/stachyose/melibiose transport system substrate-binding protein [Longispora fulva]GIG61750.1 sugar-binding protein [Longispora fulva]
MKRLNLSGYGGRGVAVLAAATLIGGLAGGCGPAKPTSADSKELTYWSMWKQGEDQQKVLQAAIDGFEKSSGVKVKVQWSGRDVLKQVAARLNAGDVPDLTDQDGAAIAGNLGAVDGVRGLADVYATTIPGESKKISDVIAPGLVASYKTKAGEPFVVPYEVFGSTMWYDAAKHPELAANPPRTWAEFITVLDAMKAKGRTPLALDGDVKSYDAYWTTWSIIRHGGPGLLAKAATDKSGDTFDNPAFLAAAKDMEQLIKGGYLAKDFNGTKWPTQQNAWAAGKSPTDFLLMGTWAPSETGPQAAPGFTYRSMPFPTVDGGKGNSAAEGGVIGFAVPAKAKHSDAAKKFIAYFMNGERLGKISSDAQNLTPRADVKAPATLADYAKELGNAGADVYLPSDNAPAVAPQWVSNVWEPANADFFNGKLDAAGFVKRLKDESVKLGKQG